MGGRLGAWVCVSANHTHFEPLRRQKCEKHAKIRKTMKLIKNKDYLKLLRYNYGPRGAPRTLWAGVEENSPLVALRNRVDRAVVDLGLEPAHRKWHPHITLGRVAYGGGSRAGRFFQDNAFFQLEPFLVTSFSLYSSLLRPNGAQHTIERTYPLAG